MNLDSFKGLLKKRLLSKGDKGFLQKFVCIPNDLQEVSDKNKNSGQNLEVTGIIVEAKISGFVFLDERCKLNFPKRTFITAVFDYYMTRNQFDEFFKTKYQYLISMEVKSNRKFVIKNIEKWVK